MSHPEQAAVAVGSDHMGANPHGNAVITANNMNSYTSSPPSLNANVGSPQLGLTNGQFEAKFETKFEPKFEPKIEPQDATTEGDLASVGGLPKTAGVDGEPPKKTPDANAKIKRPMNPFMIFGCEKRRKLAQVHPRMHNSEISKILGAEWKRMSEYEKSPYIQEAKRLKEQHSIEYPNYKFKANRRKPRQAVKKERPSFPYGGDINALPAAMKFPYPSPFFQESMYGTMYPAMASSHPAYSSMYSDYGSAIARQAMTAGGVARVVSQTPTTTTPATADYYAINKSATSPGVNDYYASLSSKGDYYNPSGTSSRSERSTPSGGSGGGGGDVVSIPGERGAYGSTADTRQFENRYSSPFNGASQPTSVATYTTSMQNISHMSNETPTAYSYSSIYEQRH